MLLKNTFPKKGSAIVILLFGLYQSAAFSQTKVTHRKIHLSKKDYENCMTGFWDMDIPKFAVNSSLDARNKINIQVGKLVRSMIKESKEYRTTDPKSIGADCDTASIYFSQPYGNELRYKVHLNDKRFLSVEIYLDSYAGGGGNGFGTEFYSFNIDLRNNKNVGIHNLFLKSREKQISRIVSREMNDTDRDVFTGDFDIFSSYSGEETRRYEFVGFVITGKSLILKYSIDYGRGNGIVELKTDLSTLKPYLRAEYLWLVK